MQKIYWHNDRFMVYQIKQLLDDNNIPNFIKNEFAIGAIGELSPMDIMPEVWLTDAEWQPKAKQLIAQFNQQTTSETEPWTCAECGEGNEANFALCWQCGSQRGSEQ
ncbi:DUF2007 domain-containing protein [Aliiglaciecola sp. M165]|uniref:putative signal transducing protein n=1 Tax=Aliiglaciecola sp. M165 TaxID=2593649 RepID=UPI00117C6C7B|nr:DUF2007 domain-containing protein [Aliiglaciecola sp. M165]TRY31870.1 DUF2007 domain-containing protein [Aliiglaciecola sp. M165]